MQESKRENFFCSGVYRLNLPMFSVSTPILATELFPGVTEGNHLLASSRSYWTCVYCPVPSPSDLWEIDLENINCSFLAKLYKCPAYII